MSKVSEMPIKAVKMPMNVLLSTTLLGVTLTKNNAIVTDETASAKIDSIVALLHLVRSISSLLNRANQTYFFFICT